MFEIMRRQPYGPRAMRELVNWIGHDPFLQSVSMTDADEIDLALDLSETDDEVIVRASLPGFKREEIDIHIHDGVLTIKAEHDEEKVTENEKFYRRERRYGSVSRSTNLPGPVSEKDANAVLEDGVLTLRLPHAQDRKPRQIPVN